jgi:hypothetical protein
MLEQLNLPVLKLNENIKDIEIYEHDIAKQNIFYGTRNSNEKIFLIELKLSKIKTEDLEKLKKLINHPNSHILNLENVSYKSKESAFLCFQFSDILLCNYIAYAVPPLEIRLSLLRQFLELMIHFRNFDMELNDFDINYIFVEGLENPTLKILYNCKYYLKIFYRQSSRKK